MTDFIFDGPNRLIIEPPGAGDASFEIERDIYSAWKRWVSSGIGAQFLPAFLPEGGTPIGATGLFTGKTAILTNGWKLKPAEHNHQCTLIGNLYSDDGVVSVPADSASATFFISGTTGAQGISTSSPSNALLESIQTLTRELHQIHGLDRDNPADLTQTSRRSGAIDQSITENPDNSIRITRND